MRRLCSLIVAVSLYGVQAIAQDRPIDGEAALHSVVATIPTAPPRTTDSITIVVGGDLGFGSSAAAPSALGAHRNGQIVPFDTLTAGLRPLLRGDVVFANLETVVSARTDLFAVDKAFNFRSHPSAVRHVVGLGLNAVSTANNHAVDYGDVGMAETLRHLDELRLEGALQAFPGVGRGRQAALAPHTVVARGISVNISAIGIGGGQLGIREDSARPTMAHYGSSNDMAQSTAALAAAGGDIRLLSVHYGTELQVRPSAADEHRLRAAASAADAHIVAAHHAHVAAGVQQQNGQFLFYGLGNLLHAGMQDMGRLGICRDYGLLARIHLRRDEGRFQVRAIEAITLVDMHAAARPRDGEDGRLRIAVLNHLAAGLDRPGSATGVRFMVRDDGSGLWCAPSAEKDHGKIGEMCREHEHPPAPSPDLTRRIATSCGAEIPARDRQVGAATVAAESSRQPNRAIIRARDWKDLILGDVR